jgi:CMP-N,N'-diacetyllegionaminic acid synthase
MKILALIPARGGSKRLPGKNIRELGGRPLINWSIEIAKAISEVSEVIVSTDDPAIASVAQAAGIEVPWLRPASLAKDDSTSVDVALHALKRYEENDTKFDGILLLQPTSPFRTVEMIKEGMELFRNSSMKSVVGVSKLDKPIEWSFKLENGYLKPVFGWESLGLSSQELTSTYIVNGSFYLVDPNILIESKSFIQSFTLPLEVKNVMSQLDIDTLEDFNLAESYLKQWDSIVSKSHIG